MRLVIKRTWRGKRIDDADVLSIEWSNDLVDTILLNAEIRQTEKDA